jgi:hypothetical protein
MEPTEPRPAARKRRALGLVAVVGVLAASGAWAAWEWLRPPSPFRAPAVTIATPYKNARPGVAYVGDAACARCHAEIVASFRRHPMGRSMALPEAGGSDGVVTAFEADGLHYAVEQRGGKTIHSETRRDAEGRVVTRAEAEVKYVLGSGAQALSFVIDRDGRLFQSPITWYTGRKQWDLSPGYQAKNFKAGYEAKNFHFERPIVPACLDCHANRYDAVEGTVNAYQTPTFRGLAIGCERCHGPGELHVRRPGVREGDRDPTIVNPRRLEPRLREAVCEQCHLKGTERLARAGRRLDDYRPGLPLEEFLAVFVEADDRPGGNPSVGHVEQMHASRCFRDSQGRLDCISCHNPHEEPPAAERIAYFRDRCLACHGDRGCALPAGERRAKSPADSCIECHMPRSALTDVDHTAATDHRIPRRPGESPRSELLASAPSGGMPLKPFHPRGQDAASRRELDRDLGVALAWWAVESRKPDEARLALPLLKEAIRARPNDLPALEARVTALGRLSRYDEALAAAEDALRLDPDRERVLVEASYLAALNRRFDEAASYSRRLVAVNPWNSANHVTRAMILAERRDWPAASESALAALRLDPTNLAARRLRMRCALASGDRATAREECLIYLAFDPPDAADVRRWLAEGMPK